MKSLIEINKRGERRHDSITQNLNAITLFNHINLSTQLINGELQVERVERVSCGYTIKGVNSIS